MQPRVQRTGESRTLTLRDPARCGESQSNNWVEHRIGSGGFGHFEGGVTINCHVSLSCFMRKRAAGAASRDTPI